MSVNPTSLGGPENISTRLKAYKYLASYSRMGKVSDNYDNDTSFANALNDLIPGFEYPNYSHMTVGNVLSTINLNKWISVV